MIDHHWATPIYHVHLEEIDNQAILEAMYRLRGEDNYAGGFTSYYDSPYAHREEPFRGLMEQILVHAHQYMPPEKGLLRPDKSWLSIMKQGGSHPAHAHPGSYISGTYYPKSVGQIWFHDPRPGSVATSFGGMPIRYYDAEAGRLILFPSWLLHEVPANLSGEDRVSFSFNIYNIREGQA